LAGIRSLAQTQNRSRHRSHCSSRRQRRTAPGHLPAAAPAPAACQAGYPVLAPGRGWDEQIAPTQASASDCQFPCCPMTGQQSRRQWPAHQ